MNRSCFVFPIIIIVLVALAVSASAQRYMEKLDRGLIAVPERGGKIYVGWRMLGTEPEEIAYNLYRSTEDGEPEKLNEEPITDSTNFVDEKAELSRKNIYTVRAVLDGKEQEPSKPFTVPAGAPERQYFTIPLQTPKGYMPNDISVGDLDGDGEYEIILHQAGAAHDNSQGGVTSPPILQAYKMDGTLLWTINLGKNIRDGAHYTQFMVYDLDGDGRAEVVCKTADGTVDGKGKVIGDANANYVNSDGRILTGPEFLTVFDGLTGAELATTKYIPARGNVSDWGDGYGNRVDRFLACIAYLDGHRPSVVMCRGYYTRAVLAAWNWRDGKLTNVWTFDSYDRKHPENKKWSGQGNHNLSVADVDGDGTDEIIYGACAINHDGTGLYSIGFGHGDAQHVSDLDPDNPGLEVFGIQERFADAGSHMFDAKTGKVLWKIASVKAGGDGEGPGRAASFDIDPTHPGFECWSFGAGITGLYDCKGNKISDKTPRSCNFAVWWDDDFLRELLDKNYISKWNWQDSTETTLLTAEGCTSNNGTKATPCLSADLFGDWREEVIWKTEDGQALRIYTTTIPTKHRIYTLMHDPQYRLSVAWQNVAYNQPPHTSFALVEGMGKPPRPNIITGPVPPGTPDTVSTPAPSDSEQSSPGTPPSQEPVTPPAEPAAPAGEPAPAPEQ